MDPSLEKLQVRPGAPRRTARPGVGDSAPCLRCVRACRAAIQEHGFLRPQEMAASNPGALASVEGFTLCRPGKGRLRWLQPVDLRDLQLDQVVAIGQGAQVPPPHRVLVGCPCGSLCSTLPRQPVASCWAGHSCQTRPWLRCAALRCMQAR